MTGIKMRMRRLTKLRKKHTLWRRTVQRDIEQATAFLERKMGATEEVKHVVH